MPILSRIRSFWKTMLRGHELDRELEEELRAAIETITRREVDRGADLEAARRVALHSLGSLERLKEDVRHERIGTGFDTLLLDVRYAWRGLRRAPGLTAIIVATLALGIGANTALFSVVHGILLEPLPYRNPDRLVFVWLGLNQTGFGRGPMSGTDLKDLRERTRSFEGLGGIWASGSVTLTDGGEPEQVRTAYVTTNFFDVLGARPAFGRTFTADDGRNGAEPTILLGWDLFARRFGADPTLVGRTIRVNDDDVRVIGVMPRPFRLLLPPGASVPDDLQAWTPFWPDFESGPRGNLFIRVIARMREDVTLRSAREDVDAMARLLSQERGRRRAFNVAGLHEDAVREIRQPLLALFACVGILLAIASLNVASLLLARGAARAQETAVRIALGASPGRIGQQALVEGLLLTALGVAAGIAAGYLSLRLLLAMAPPSLSRLDVSRIDGTVLTFTVLVSAFCGVLFSLAPVAAFFRRRHFQTASDRSPSASIRHVTRARLTILQIALSTTLLAVAALLVQAFVQVLRVDPGFRADRHLTFRLAIPGRYGSTEAFNRFATALQERLAAIPGVTGVGAISHLPYDDLPNWALPYNLEGPAPPDARRADARAISVGLFETMDVRLVEGRFFTEQDQNANARVVIVDEGLARQLWPGRSAVSQSFFLASQRVTVVGVVRHLRLRSLVEDLAPQVFQPWAIAQRNPIAFLVGTNASDPALLAAQVRTAVAELDPRVPIYDVRPLRAYIQTARSTRRFTMSLASAFALAALAVTCVGLYGVLASVVVHRRREFAVRRALGADGRRIAVSALGEGLAFGVAGCVLGVAGALLAGQLLQSQLYGVPPGNPLSYAVAVALVLGASILACAIPAFRATAANPMDVLRTE